MELSQMGSHEPYNANSAPPAHIRPCDVQEVALNVVHDDIPLILVFIWLAPREDTSDLWYRDRGIRGYIGHDIRLARAK